MSDFTSQEIDQVFKALETSDTGLDSGEALQRQARYGRNEIDSSDGTHPWRILVDQFKSFIIYILLFAVVFAVAIGEYVDSLIIIIIVAVNAAIGFFQEFSAAKSLAALKKMTTVQATVHRDGRWHKVEAAELVPGDIVRLAAGDKVPADCRLFTDAVFAVEESSLTGESLPVEKTSMSMSGQATIAEQRNMVFSSTAVVSGNATAVVVKTGMETEIGIITRLIKEAEEELTPLQKRLNSFGRRLGGVIIAICIFVLLASCAKELMAGNGLSKELFVAFAFIAISLAVAAVPTALPAVVTIALSIGVKRLLARKALVRKLSAVETLGSCDVICSDKTGTITKNEMTVRKVWTFASEYDLEGRGYNPEEGALDLDQVPLVIQSGFFCNNATLFEEKGRWRITGNPTEAALIVSAAKCGFEEEAKRLAELPFDSGRKRMSVLVARGQGEEMFSKGGADGLLDSCSHALVGEEVVELNQKLRGQISSRIDQYASQAMRVLAFAWKELKQRQDFVEENLVFVGLQAMIDPPRPEVHEALELSRQAGVRVIMITGDYPETARAIGEEVGISGGVLTGTDMDRISDSELDAALDGGVNIFARVVPEHKQRIVTMLQQQDHTVAMTGDGVNDAPALKKANIGIAVGSGTDVAKEAADFVLTDDSFAHIVGAIEEGRGIYDNIQKSIMLLLSGNLGEVLIVFLAVILGMNLPLTAVMLLWINMVTDGAPALAYSVDSYGDQIMGRPPKPKGEGILPGDKLLLLLVLGVAGTCIALALFVLNGGAGDGDHLIVARTMVFNFVVCYEMILVFAIRQGYGVSFFSNPFIWLSVIVSLALQALILYTPLAQYFDVVPLVSGNFLHLAVAGLLFYLMAVSYQLGFRFWQARRQVNP
ncbi:MAG: cation-translocating P-type ATPase [Thermodesulfobacteriota bacterium]